MRKEALAGGGCRVKTGGAQHSKRNAFTRRSCRQQHPCRSSATATSAADRRRRRQTGSCGEQNLCDRASVFSVTPACCYWRELAGLQCSALQQVRQSDNRSSLRRQWLLALRCLPMPAQRESQQTAAINADAHHACNCPAVGSAHTAGRKRIRASATHDQHAIQAGMSNRARKSLKQQTGLAVVVHGESTSPIAQHNTSAHWPHRNARTHACTQPPFRPLSRHTTTSPLSGMALHAAHGEPPAPWQHCTAALPCHSTP